jgi:hypothetical protein
MLTAILRAMAFAAAICLSPAAQAHADPAKVLRALPAFIAVVARYSATNTARRGREVA